MDSTGAAHLWGGEAGMLIDVEARLAAQGLTARVAMAPTRGAAWALARFGSALAICGQDDLADTLAPLPARALRLTPEAARVLDRLGLRTIGMLAALPRAALLRRFRSADGPLAMLDRAMGRLPEPLDAAAEPARFIARMPLPEPTMDAAPWLPELCERLCADLARDGRGVRLLRLTIYRTDGEARSCTISTARAAADPAHLERLLIARAAGLDPGFGFDLIALEAPRTESLTPRQMELDGRRDAEADLATLIDRLTARLGPGAVTWSAWRESHLPERVERRVPALGTAPATPPAIPRARPIRLLEPPEELRVLYAVPEGPPVCFVWRGVEHRALRHQGPERLAPEWWRARPGTRLRDYYRIEVEDGRRFWIFREGIASDGRGGAPHWFMHGFFA